MHTLSQALKHLVDHGMNARMFKDQLLVIYGKKSKCSTGEMVVYSHVIFILKEGEYWMVSPPREGKHELNPSEHSNLTEAISRVITIVKDFAA